MQPLRTSYSEGAVCAFLKYLFFQRFQPVRTDERAVPGDGLLFPGDDLYYIDSVSYREPVFVLEMCSLRRRTSGAWSVRSQLCCPFSVAAGQANSPFPAAVRLPVRPGSGPACGLPFCDGLA